MINNIFDFDENIVYTSYKINKNKNKNIKKYKIEYNYLFWY